MTEPTIMGKVLDFPAKTTDPDDIQDDVPTAPAADGAGEGGHDGPPPAVTATAPDDDGAGEDGVRVLVDSPPGPEPSKLATVLATRRAQRRPIIAPWLRDKDEFREMSRWTAGHIGHTAVYHAVRVPKYAGRLTLRAPRGAIKVVTGLGAWCADAEAMPLRVAAVARTDADAYMKLLRMRDDRVRWRRIVTAAVAAGAVAVAAVLAVASPLTQLAVGGVLVTVLGWYGSPPDRPLLDVAVVVPRMQKLTSEIVIRALSVLGIGEINKAMARGGEGITFPNPIQRDGPGWRADVELPHGVTVFDVMEKRTELASGLRRQLGCVWPEPTPGEHPGRMVLWVGDRDMAQTPPPAWPLAKGGRSDLFAPIPFGTDQRGRNIDVTWMYSNGLIGAMPGMGKSFAVVPLACATALDVNAQLRLFNLKGDRGFAAFEKVAHHYATGLDDATVLALRDSLREVKAEIERRAATIRDLPSDLCPESKVTPELAAKRVLGLFPLVFIIDECQNAFSHGEYGKEIGELAMYIIKLGRAFGVILVLATQRPDKDSLPTGVSANVGIRFCLRVMGQVENDMILGTSMYKKGIQATTFTRKDRGIGYLVGDADDPQIVRTYYIDGPAAEVICTRAKVLRQQAGTLTGYAAGEDTTPDQGLRVSLLDDVAAVIGADDKVWSHVIVDRLAELRPDIYGDWANATTTIKAKQLAAALKPYGIETMQVFRKTETGTKANNRGVSRDDITTAIDAAHRSRE